MAKIQSDASVASTCATAIQSGASGITAVGAPTKDSNSDYTLVILIFLTDNRIHIQFLIPKPILH